MPRTPRDEKREEILGVTWRLIAQHGLRAANMRALAAEAGYANGALGYYFTNKEELIKAAFQYVVQRTAARIQLRTRGLSGVRALRKFCAEVLPLDQEKLLEARIVVPFWEESLHEPSFARLHEESMQAFREQLRRHLREAEKLGELRALTAKQRTVAVEQLLSILMGAQVLGVLSGALHSPAMQRAVLHAYLDGLAMR